MTDPAVTPVPDCAAPPGEVGVSFRPPLPDGYVARPRLCERLQQGLTGRLLLISAPAGFGKSSLASEFCESLPINWQSLWLALGSRDSDPGRFLGRLFSGLHTLFPHLGSEAVAVLNLRQRHQPFDFEVWLDGLLNDLFTQLDPGKPLLLVFDDYHLARNSVLDACLQFLINHLPVGLVLLVTSRQRPEWHLARLRLASQVLELHETDLRLGRTEVESLLRAQGVSLPLEDLTQLCLRSEGWVAGLRLWLLTAQEQRDGGSVIADLQGDRGLIRDYLLEEVIGRQPEAVQAFLYQTAGQERICAELCDALREARDSAAVLQHLQAHQVFLVPLDRQGRWFRYHHLFSDLLRARPDCTAAAARHLRASHWFAGHNLLAEAVEQALRAGQPAVAADLVQDLSEEQLLGEQDFASLLRWKSNLPDSLLSSTPRLILLYGWALTLACQLDAAEDLLAQLQRFLPAPDARQQRSLSAQWLALSGVIARGQGNSARAREHCLAALQDLPVERYGQRLLCLSTLANLALGAGEVWRARELNRTALELAQRVGNPLFEALAHLDRAGTLQARGAIVRALGEVDLGLTRLQALSGSAYATRARLRVRRGHLLALRLQPEEARQALLAGVSEARECRDLSLLSGYCHLAALEGGAGRFSEAFMQLAEAERQMHLWDVPAVCCLAIVTLSKCELWLAQGQLELASAWLQRLAQTYCTEQPAAPPELYPHLPQHIALLQARLAIAQGRHDEAQRQLLYLLDKQDASLPLALARVELIVLLRRGGHDQEALAHWHNCLPQLAGGASSAFARLLTEEPEWFAERLQEHPHCPHCRWLLTHLPIISAAPERSAERLSVRERDVLQLIAQGHSNQQISERLFISLPTVKTHARRINSKLGVARRTQAVARATELGLLN